MFRSLRIAVLFALPALIAAACLATIDEGRIAADGGSGGEDAIGGGGADPLLRKPIELRPTTIVEDVPAYTAAIAIAQDADLVGLESGDLVFTAVDGVTLLPHEIEHFDPVAGTLAAWVHMPTVLANEPTTLYLYLGHPDLQPSSPTLAWPEPFAGVWHMAYDEDAPLKQLRDSSPHGHHASWSNETEKPLEAAGIMAGCVEAGVDTRNLSIADPADGSLDPLLDSFSVSLWVLHATPLNQWDEPFFKASNFQTFEPGYSFALGNDGWSTNVSDGTTLASLTLGHFDQYGADWAQVALVIDRVAAEVYSYTNGVRRDTEPAPAGMVDSPDPIDMAAGHNPYLGRIDEVRAYHTALTPAWIALSYENLARMDTFVWVGPAEPAP